MQTSNIKQGNIQSGKTRIEKLKDRKGISLQKLHLAQKGSEEQAFWDRHVDGLAVAILIAECEE